MYTPQPVEGLRMTAAPGRVPFMLKEIPARFMRLFP